MKKILASLMLLAVGALASAHPGGLDKEGCHNDKTAGERHCHPERLLAKLLATCELTKPPKAGEEGVFFGKLIRVSDGDTFEAKVQGVVMDFRLAEADAPEKDQPYGDVSRKSLQTLLKSKDLVLVPIDVDRYGRTIAFVWTGNACINKEMIRRGDPWFYDEFAETPALHAVEDQARDARIGLWKLPPKQRIEPWVWRREER